MPLSNSGNVLPSRSVQELPGIENTLRIQRLLQPAVGLEGNLAERLADPAFLGDADAVLAGDGTAVFEDPGNSRSSAASARSRTCRVLIVADHQVGVDVAVAGVAEAGDGDAGLRLELSGELDQLDELGARDDDVLVELGQAGVAQGVGKLAAQFPDALAGRLVRGALDEGGAECS